MHLSTPPAPAVKMLTASLHTKQEEIRGFLPKKTHEAKEKRPTDTDRQILRHSPSEIVRFIPDYPIVKPTK